MKYMKSQLSIVLVLLYSKAALAFTVYPWSSSLPWSSTLSCDPWKQGNSYETGCDSLVVGGGSSFCNGTTGGEITAAANNPSGAGGSGYRHWEGDGSNNNSGGVILYLSAPQPEIWIRWYMRYQAGFNWNPLIYDKWLYIHSDTSAAVPGWYDPDRTWIWSAADGNHASTPGNGWSSTMGGTVSDGKFHHYEVHLKMDTNGSNGVAELWIDGIRRIFATNVNFGTDSGWTWVHVGSNQSTPANGGCRYIDFDDLVINTTGYIGPLPPVTPDAIPPSQPLNLEVK